MATAASIHDVVFPERISLGATGGPEFLTRIVTTSAGHEYRNIAWDEGRGRWNVAHGVKDAEEAAELHAFFRARRGRAYGFRFKDWFDFRAEYTPFAIGDGSTTVFQMKKNYNDGTHQVDRIITKIAYFSAHGAPDPVIYLNGVQIFWGTHYTIDLNKGIIYFVSPPAAGAILRWTGEFHVPARFDTDSLNATLVAYDVIDWQDIPVVELRPEEVLGL